ncbi:ATP-dependent zinc metalloprotease FtsH [Massilicoli timonensis]|uniref:ATP-dependent zinc metalloprotease FtsH n=2 Tax=Massilicoli timonensis TaxID=2015901 RepID=A0ABT1SK36_9FIRM|nr:ATP-dependent zinc metalloprotease FtsH [Massilicoli timonensis]MCQ5121594.1 ATP-dependent zinc metalloprotease FtsH [Massilicoli timonensis]HIR15485.1 ATP-dependent zinc metalloprotease FtsH [Candidatus Onthosoma merdavium]
MKNNRYVNFLPYVLVIAILLMLGSFSTGTKHRTFSYNEFVSQAEKMTFGDVNISVGTSIVKVEGTYRSGGEEQAFDVSMPKTTKNLEWLQETLDEEKNQVTVSDADERNIFLEFMMQIVPLLLVMGVGFFILMKSSGGANNKAFEFTKSRARIESDVKTRFADVAGCKEEKEEVKEIIDYLKNPTKFSEMGARIPKGMLMVGPPGTGKTLLAKAVAGEANVPFFSISGSDFVEMFVGTGASRVRDMFKRAKQAKPCIIFIDEIDAVGRQRGAGLGGGNDEREQTLNQILVEMDGMNENAGIVVIAATNRADVLDPALMRSGRFDRQITVGLPDKTGRYEILQVHARNKKLAPNVNLEQLAKRTQGFSGADLENVLNEAAILAVREDRHLITMSDLDEAIDRVMMGPAKKSKKYTDKEKRMVAYHEAGHAVIGLKLEGANSVQKITIIPRGQAGGYNLMTKEEETYCTTKSEYMAMITSFLGGRVSEEVVFNEITDGAYGDLEQVTKIAKAMVRSFGMSKLGPIQYSDNSGNVFLGRDYSQGSNYSGEIAFEIDKEIRRIVNECYDQAKEIIVANRDLLDLIAKTLIEEETITAEQIKNLAEYGTLRSPEEQKAEAETAALEAQASEQSTQEATMEASDEEKQTLVESVADAVDETKE